MIPVTVARYLHSEGKVVYDEAGAAGYCFTGPLPPEPDLAVSIRQYGGEGDIKFPYDTPRVQVRVRAATNDEALEKAQEIYEALHGLALTVLDSGGDAEKFMVDCRAMDLPSPVGSNESQGSRPEYVTNYEIEHAVSAARRTW
jgi:hypothetical protein